MEESNEYSNIDLLRLQAIEELSDSGIIATQLDGTITNWNAGAERIFGYSIQEVVGKNISAIIPKDLQSEEKDIMRKLQRGERIEPYTTKRLHKSGRVVVVSVGVSSIRNEAGLMIGASKIVRDASVLETAIEKQALLATIVSSSDDAIVSKNIDGYITSWNKAAENIFGYSENEIIGKHITTIIPSWKLDEERHIMDKIRRGELVDHLQTIRRRKDGIEIPIMLTVSPVKDNKGQIIGASKIARNISDQQQSEEKQALLASIINSSDDAIVSKTLQGFITSWNVGAEKIFGYKEQEMLGKHINTIIPPERQDEEHLIINRIRNGDRIEHFETVRLAKDGRYINVSITVSPIINNTGKIIGASKIARDISEKIELANELREKNERLLQLNNAKDEFIGMASHELKTPLTSITAFLQLLERNLDETTNRKLVDKALRHVKKLSSLVSDLLDVSKIEAGKLQLNLRSFKLAELVEETIETVQSTITSHHIDFNYITDTLIIADKERVEQVIINLLTNAVKYSPNATRIEVKMEKCDNWIIVSVTDFGIGVPADQAEQIFNRFYRAKGLRPTFSGLGIGLYISNEIIERHKGKIWVESAVGKGSTFFFKLPVHNPERELW